jgi:hypothetical protein
VIQFGLQMFYSNGAFIVCLLESDSAQLSAARKVDPVWARVALYPRPSKVRTRTELDLKL